MKHGRTKTRPCSEVASKGMEEQGTEVVNTLFPKPQSNRIMLVAILRNGDHHLAEFCQGCSWPVCVANHNRLLEMQILSDTSITATFYYDRSSFKLKYVKTKCLGRNSLCVCREITMCVDLIHNIHECIYWQELNKVFKCTR